MPTVVAHLLQRAARRLALGAALGLAALAQAQTDFPARRITLVVPAAPGGGLDATARLLAKRMTEAWGQPVLIENQGAADGLIATQRVAAAPPDGTIMLLQIPALLLLEHNAKDAPKGLVAAFTPVSELGRTPSAVTVSARLPVKTLDELVRYCKAAATPCTWGSGQQLSYLYGRRLFAVSGIAETTHVPYKGTAPVINDLLGGHITVGITSIAAPLSHHRQGALRMLAVNTPARSAQAPDVPTFHEAGLDVPARGSWYGLFVPAKTPPEVVGKIEAFVRTLAGDRAAAEVMASIGAEPVFGSSREFAQAVHDEAVFLEALIKQVPLR